MSKIEQERKAQQDKDIETIKKVATCKYVGKTEEGVELQCTEPANHTDRHRNGKFVGPLDARDWGTDYNPEGPTDVKALAEETVNMVAGETHHTCGIPTNPEFLSKASSYKCPECGQCWKFAQKGGQWEAAKITGQQWVQDQLDEATKSVNDKIASGLPTSAFGDPTRQPGEAVKIKAPNMSAGINPGQHGGGSSEPLMSGLPGGQVEYKAIAFQDDFSRSEEGLLGQAWSTSDADHGGVPYNPVEPPHYKRGPIIKGDIGSRITQGKGAWVHVVQCIEVMRHIKDPRLATAFKYLWRVAFGGKREPGETRSQAEIDKRDLESAIWYLNDYIENPT